ncbi:hypothetical protein [Streptomyces adelaidensis]|uniref:hypothetical protein n=1 Tax=Streptomyces adelaidensis TaxID=2796465 RepID=UPI001903FD43|nr:hypothetical protein [Streptomyces adelaidensis]
MALTQWSLELWLPAGFSVLIALHTLARQGSSRVLGWAFAVAVGNVLLAVCVLVPVSHPLLGAFFLLGTVTAATAVGLTQVWRAGSASGWSSPGRTACTWSNPRR